MCVCVCVCVCVCRVCVCVCVCVSLQGDDADESLAANLPLTLDACPAGGVRDGTLVKVEDFTQVGSD